MPERVFKKVFNMPLSHSYTQCFHFVEPSACLVCWYQAVDKVVNVFVTLFSFLFSYVF